jgi:mono/diheme cytochrome c family protein
MRRSLLPVRQISLAIMSVCFCFALNDRALAAQAPGRTILDSVYTTAQAARGEALFAAKCRSCHVTESLAGNTALPLKADLFIERWREDYLQSLFNKMIGFMPPPNVSPRLKDEEYVDIISFLLQQNGYPAGAQELKLDQLGSTLFVGMNGPQPVPNLAQVLVVGCLTPAANDNWTLTKATEPLRTRQPDSSTPEELKSSDARPLGSQTFQIRGIDNLTVSFDPEAHKGKKVQAKGVLNRQTAGNRINVLSMGVLSATCGQ